MLNKIFIPTMLCRGVVFILCINLVTGCTAFKPVPLAEPQSVMTRIRPGDTVRLTTRDGVVHEFKVKEATAEQLTGENERVELSAVSAMERREFSTWKTASMVALSTIIFGVIQALSTKSGGWGRSP